MASPSTFLITPRRATWHRGSPQVGTANLVAEPRRIDVLRSGAEACARLSGAARVTPRDWRTPRAGSRATEGDRWGSDRTEDVAGSGGRRHAVAASVLAVAVLVPIVVAATGACGRRHERQPRHVRQGQLLDERRHQPGARRLEPTHGSEPGRAERGVHRVDHRRQRRRCPTTVARRRTSTSTRIRT